MSKITSHDILKDIRIKHINDAVVREVGVSDPFEQGYRARDHINRYPRSEARTREHYEVKNGITIPDELPEGWSYRDSVPYRRIDALIFESTQITAIEIKVSRSDFFRDTEDKRKAWKAYTDRFIYVTPKGLVTKDEVPEGCGLWEYDIEAKPSWRQHSLVTVVRAKKNKNRLELPKQVIRALAFRVSNYEREYEKSKLKDD
jgi:hypothetical protein